MSELSFRDEDRFRRLKEKWKILEFLEKEVRLPEKDEERKERRKLTVGELRKLLSGYEG